MRFTENRQKLFDLPDAEFTRHGLITQQDAGQMQTDRCSSQMNPMKSCNSAGLVCYPGRLTTIATLAAVCITRPGTVGATTIDADTTTVDGTGLLPEWSLTDPLYVSGLKEQMLGSRPPVHF